MTIEKKRNEAQLLYCRLVAPGCPFHVHSHAAVSLIALSDNAVICWSTVSWIRQKSQFNQAMKWTQHGHGRWWLYSLPAVNQRLPVRLNCAAAVHAVAFQRSWISQNTLPHFRMRKLCAQRIRSELGRSIRITTLPKRYLIQNEKQTVFPNFRMQARFEAHMVISFVRKKRIQIARSQ